MITLHYSGNNAAIITAVEKANEVLSSAAFYEKIAGMPKMSNTKLTSVEIASILKAADQNIIVNTFWNPFGAVSKTRRPYKFSINRSKISTVTAFAVNTLINEAVQAIALSGRKLTHFDCNPEHEPNSLPWKIGEIAEIISRKARRYA